MFHDLLHTAVFFACLFAVIHPRVPTGILGTAGLGAIMVGVLYSIDDMANQRAALDVVVGGLAITAVSLLYRILRHPKHNQMRRTSDWQATVYSDEDEPETMPPAMRDGMKDQGSR